MRSKHQRTLNRIFTTPTPASIRWGDIESMLRASGVEIIERAGSRVLIKKGIDRMVVHRPHPSPEASRATVRDIAGFLTEIGVEP